MTASWAAEHARRQGDSARLADGRPCALLEAATAILAMETSIGGRRNGLASSSASVAPALIAEAAGDEATF